MMTATTSCDFGRNLLELGLADGRAAVAAVAKDEALAWGVAQGALPPTVRVWENGRAIAFPRLRERDARTFVAEDGTLWTMCNRGSGGAAVAHGPGTLNVSLILPLRGRFSPSIDACYRLWVGVLSKALIWHGILVEANGVDAAFCPGQHDLSVDGRKIAGVAQDRRHGSVVVHGTILVDVDCGRYLRVIEHAEQLLGLTNRYDPQRVVSLRQLVGSGVSLTAISQSIMQAAEESTI